MIVDIPDEWIKRCLNANPDEPVENALSLYFQNRNGSADFEKHLIFALGERTLHELGKNLK